MEYYRLLNLSREPFSSSPEPDFFYESLQHVECLQKLELVLRLRRGLSVVIGQVGAGKTTLSRQLIRKFAADPEVRTHLMLDPHFSTEREFLLSVARLFCIHDVGEEDSPWRIRERIKNHLFHQAVERKKLVVLIIDEGQKLPDFAMESLREFLNYETNECKLLQIAIFAQEEFRQNLERHPGFEDRINLTYHLGPLNFQETSEMVLFRLNRAAEKGEESSSVRFTKPALMAIYRETEGYPRKVVRMCHQVLIAMIIKNKGRVDRRLVKDVVRRSRPEYKHGGLLRLKVPVAAVIFLMVAGAAVYYGLNDHGVPSREGSCTSGGNVTTTAHVDAGTTNRVAMEPAQSMMRSTAIMYSDILVSDSHATELPPEENLSAAIDCEAGIKSPSGSAEKTGVTIAEETAMADQEMPAVLGTIEIARNQFVCRMLRSVYGICDSHLKETFKENNPAISDLNHVEVGQIVTIPAVADDRKEFYERGVWIRIDETDSFSEAYQRLRMLNLPESETRILPYWTAGQGLRFAIVFKKSYKYEQDALQALEYCRKAVDDGCEIVETWPDDAVFYGKR